VKVGVVQLNSGDNPEHNLSSTKALIAKAALDGASLVVTPEVTNCVSLSRRHQQRILRTEAADRVLAAVKAQAKDLGIHILIGSLALKSEADRKRFVNRSFLIRPDGSIAARYDKIHLFDVCLSASESFSESDAYCPGSAAVVSFVGDMCLGHTICYDVRFPSLFRKLAQSGAEVIVVPSAFSPTTGSAHWEVLLRARAIETGCFILAPAQTGTHAAIAGKNRTTYGHSMVISPWGDVILDAGTIPGAHVVELDLEAVKDARRRMPSLTHDRDFSGP